MTYPPVKIIKPGTFAFDGATLCVRGWTFDLCGRPTPEGQNPVQVWLADCVLAAMTYLNEYAQKNLGVSVGRTVAPAREDVADVVSMDIEIDAQRATAELIQRLGAR